MSRVCSQCQTMNDVIARFCQQCGATLGATLLQGRTVVAPFSPPLPAGVSEILSPSATPVGGAAFRFLEQATGCETPAAPAGTQHEVLVLNLDTSGSMGEQYSGDGTKLEAAIRFAVNLAVRKAKIDERDEIGLVTFNETARTQMSPQPLSSHKQEIITKLQALRSGGGTDIRLGLAEAEKLFSWIVTDGAQRVTRRVTLLTDGHGNDPLDVASRLKSLGTVIDVVGIGSDPSCVNEILLKQVASTVDGVLRYRFIKDCATLLAHGTQLATKTRVGG